MNTQPTVIQGNAQLSDTPRNDAGRVAAPSGTDFAPGIEAAFPPKFEEYDATLECVAGQVPKFVRGTYYLNGPARFRMNNICYRHWLDGDGMAVKLRFDATGIHFRNRYIQ